MSESEDAPAPARESAGTPRKPPSQKIRYAEHVTMTEEEYGKLVEKHGEEVTKWCIDKLNNYKGATGKTYANDYSAILKWVIDSYREEQAKHKQQTPARPQGGNPFINAVLNGGEGSG